MDVPQRGRLGPWSCARQAPGRAARWIGFVASAGVGRGASFSVRLPRTEARNEESAALPSTTSKSPGKKRVLVIDDNDDARKALATLLAFEGHETYEAADGAWGAELASHVRP